MEKCSANQDVSEYLVQFFISIPSNIRHIEEAMGLCKNITSTSATLNFLELKPKH